LIFTKKRSGNSNFRPVTNEVFLKHETFSCHETKSRDRIEVEASENSSHRVDNAFLPKKSVVKVVKKRLRAGKIVSTSFFRKTEKSVSPRYDQSIFSLSKYSESDQSPLRSAPIADVLPSPS
jgi:hypothetical protein